MALTKGAKVVAVILIAAAAGGGYAYWKSNHEQQKQETVSVQTIPQTVPAAPAKIEGFVPTKDTLKSIVANHVVRISVENPSEPFYGTAGGVAHGFNVDFARLLFAQPEFVSGGKPVIVDTSHEVSTYKDVPQQLVVTDPQGDSLTDIAMDGLTFADNTPQGVVYSVPYVDDFGYALIVGPNSAVRGAQDLAGRTIGILQGDPDVKAFVSRMYPGAHIVEISDSDPHFIDKSVDDHVVDAFVYDYPFAVESIKGTDLKFAVTKLDGSSLAYKIGVRATDTSLLIYLNSAIAKVKNSQAYLDLLRRYFISDQVVVTAATGGERTYVVRAGDTLRQIAVSQLNNGSRYQEIQRRNNLPNPNLIQVGQRLVLPHA